MAISKNDLLTAISEYGTTNKRPCAKNNIIATHGESALAVLKELIADGSVACRRGRNGGYYAVTAPAVVESEPPSADEAAEIAEVNDLSEQFAALNARLAAAEAAEQEAAAPVEDAPF
jgi:hypothetical protein